MANLVLVAVYVSVDVCRKVGGSRGENRYIVRIDSTSTGYTNTGTVDM